MGAESPEALTVPRTSTFMSGQNSTPNHAEGSVPHAARSARRRQSSKPTKGAIINASHAAPTPTSPSISRGQNEDAWTAQARTAFDLALAVLLAAIKSGP